jgi:hypothetical protein
VNRETLVGAPGICLLGTRLADGQVSGLCRARKGKASFQAFLQQVIVPEALRREVHDVSLILDNGTTHAPKQLEGWLPEQEQAHAGQLHFRVYWLPTNARLSRSTGDLVQYSAAQSAPAQSRCQYGRLGANHQ